MKAISRRDLYAPVSALFGIGSETTFHARPQLGSQKPGEPILSKSEVLSPDRIPVTTMPNGGKSWPVIHGVLATGEAIAVHESLQPAGISPSPEHTIQHSELILVQEGTLLFEHDGRSDKVGPGGVIFVATGTKHTARNVGDGPAKYLVIAIGGDSR